LIFAHVLSLLNGPESLGQVVSRSKRPVFSCCTRPTNQQQYCFHACVCPQLVDLAQGSACCSVCTRPHSCLQVRLSHADHHSSEIVLLVPVYRPTQRQLMIAAALTHAAPAFARSTCVSGAPLCCSSAVNAAQYCATVLPTGNGYYCHGKW
jgi:hypothetical protein